MWRSLLPWTAVFILCCGTISASAAPPVHLELLIEGNPALSGGQKWSRFLSKCAFSDVRVRGGRPGDKMALDQKGTERSPRYYVTGILNARNMLELPGGKFRYGDQAGIDAWIKKLQVEGKEELFAIRGTFGLTKDELVAVHKSLSKPISVKTKGVRAGNVTQQVIVATGLPFSVSRLAQAAFQGQETVAEELLGMSSGTALAAAIRPLGLVLAPRKSAGKKVEIHIATTREVKESWPVGWPPEKSPGQAFPKMFKFLTISVNKSELSKALTTLESRTEGPFLFDHNALARHRIDPATVKVSFEQKRSFYKRVIDDLLRQALLKSEIRVDENGKAFLWISTLQR